MTEWQLFFFLLLWLVLVVEGVALFVLYRHVAVTVRRSEALLPRASVAPEFEGFSLQEESVSSAQLLANGVGLFIFGSFNCDPCLKLLDNREVANFVQASGAPAYFLFREAVDDVTVSDSFQHHVYRNWLAPIHVDTVIFEKYLISKTPSVYILNHEHRVLANGTATSRQDFEQLFRQVTRSDKTTVEPDVEAKEVFSTG